VGVLTRNDIGRAAQAACVLEAVSAKPGNVNRLFDFADTTLGDFLLSAVMIGQCMEEADRYPLGQTVLSGVQATRRVVGRNTNLGMILLFAPLAKAYGQGDLRTAVRQVLESSTVEDALLVSQAIRLAGPGGLGTAPEHDVVGDPRIPLLELMSLAGERDSVAKEYATGFAITFELAYPTLDGYLKQESDFCRAVVQTYLSVLAEVPDTLIARKKGLQEAKAVSRKAAGVSRAGETERREFDQYLRSEGNSLNPGTTADLVAAAIFTYFLERGLESCRNRVIA